jgi:hypothetical protein
MFHHPELGATSSLFCRGNVRYHCPGCFVFEDRKWPGRFLFLNEGVYLLQGYLAIIVGVHDIEHALMHSGHFLE